MCGIAGFCDFRNNFLVDREKWLDTLVSMRESLAHRGKDQTGEYLRRNIALAHTRLSIRDIAGGRQPMVKHAGDSDVAIVYNGEIYNTEEIKAELEKAGYEFKTTSDTEVILSAYIHYGRGFVKFLNGIFSFAIWDGRRDCLLLYRDRAGVKPLFYTLQGSLLVFGSEIKSLFCHLQIKPRADDDSFREIFGIGPARTPGVGVFKGIREIKPGCMGEFSRNGFDEKAYWQISPKHHDDSYDDTVAKVRWLVDDAVKRQMVSDVPVCSFLSGGVDSSIVTAIAARHLEAKGGKLNTFSFDFAGNDKYFSPNSFQPTRDRPFVDKMLKILSVNHRYLTCDERELAELLIPSMESHDLPCMTDVDASLMYFCNIVKDHNKVALTGECADEIFGGYPWFYRAELLNGDDFPWSLDMSARTVLLRDDVIERLNLKDYSHERYVETLNEAPHIEGESKDEYRHREISYLNLRWFMQTLLNRMDRTSMSCSLEARVPFADHRIIEYLYNVPWHMKYREGCEKALLRDAFRDVLPHELLYRKKSPYPKTYDPEYEELLKVKLKNILYDVNAPINKFIDREKTEQFLQSPKDYGRPWFGQLMAAPQMMAYMIQVNGWMEKYNVG